MHRASLIDTLAGGLEPGTLQLGTEVVTLADQPAADLLVAADGINSRVRAELFPGFPGPVHTGVTSWRLVVEHPGGVLPQGETWGGGRVFGITALGDGRLYCYATAHAMTPNLGQGACQAIEDAAVLAACDGDPARYSAERLPRVTRISKASRRVGRIAGLDNPAAEWARNTGMALTARLFPDQILSRMDDVMTWRPPT
jgi:2-polyprenyl-6-methoxyphenol hydroxylase-like FAD-dependent oxidoreductase